MDEGRPFRVSQSTGGRVSGRPESMRRQPEKPQPPVSAEPKTTPPVATRTQAKTRQDKSRKWFVWPIIIVAICLVLVAGWLAWTNLRGAGSIAGSGKYQAVTVTDGQIYFGKLSVVDKQHVKLTNAYYLQAEVGETATENSDQSTDQNNVKLIKLGNKIYGPDDEIVIAKSQVVSYENLNPSGQVAEWLKDNSQAN